MSPIDCNQMRELITAYADGELDAQQRALAERHLGDCPECSQSLKRISALKAAMRDDVLLFNVPGALKKKIETMVAKAADPPTGAKAKPSRPVLRLRHLWIATAAGLALAAGMTGYWLWPSARERIEAQAVRDYRQSQVSMNPTQLDSSDPQSVLHWLSGRLGFSPLAPNQLPTGYKLVGGRIDVLDGRPVAVLIYHNGLRISNLFQWPSSGAVESGDVDTIQGLGVKAWNAAGMNFCIVSDEGAPAVGEMANVFISQGCGPR